MEEKKNWKRDIILFMSSQTISLFGSALVQYAIMWYVTLSTKSGLMMTLFIVCGFIPTFLLSPFAGVWADRFNRKYLIMIADAMIAIVTLILALLFLAGYNEPWLMFVIAAVRALGAGIQTPAVGAILPQIVPEDQLTKVNGINGTLQALMMFVAPIVSAALLSYSTIEAIFFIDVVTAAVAISALFFFLRIPLHRKAEDTQTTSYLEDFKQGVTYIRNHSFLKPFFIFFAFFCTLLLGVIPIFWIYLFVMAVFGVAMPMANTPTTVMLQEKVDPNYMGRIFGVFGMISTSMMPIGMLIFGPLADVMKIEWLLVGTGLLFLVLTMFFVSSKRLIEAGKPVVQAEG